MCGIAGYVLRHADHVAPRYIGCMLGPIQPRGPDDEGVALIDRTERAVLSYRTDLTAPGVPGDLDHAFNVGERMKHDVGFIHTRYSIIDLSEGGHQPFASHDASVTAIFNGEIYNYVELRSELEKHGIRFRTSSDTEVLVEGYRFWGDEVWNRLNGFWAVALYDKRDSSVVLCRDRVGIAPLYYRNTENGLFFSSAIRSLIEVDASGIEIDQDVVSGFMDTCIKDFHHKTCYRQIRSLAPGSFVRLKCNRSAVRDSDEALYWRLPDRHVPTADWPFEEAVEQYRETFLDAVALRLRADVKVAFELSGGLDSSSIVAAAAGLRNCDITTYTIKVRGLDEEPYARAMLERYPVDYRVLRKPEEAFFEESDGFTRSMEEPYHSPNIFTHYKMRQRMKAEGVYVVLTGAGGDEVLAGYEDLFWSRAADDLRAEGLHGHVQSYVRAQERNRVERREETNRRFPGRLGRELCNRAAAFVVDSLGRVRRFSEPGWKTISLPVLERSRVVSEATRLKEDYASLSYFEQRRFHFEIGLLPYYLRSNDHFTMAIPLEARFPFLDHRMVELGMTLPPSYLFRDGWTKYILRRAMEPFLPEKILWRKTKMGFPFAYERFLSRNRRRLAPMLEVVQRAGIATGFSGHYDAHTDADAVRTWRICSTGLWLETMNTFQGG